jgi:parvulin-like peptidyl-prolyl isomerase
MTRNQLDAEGYAEVVENWINTEIVYQRAVEKGLDKDPAVKAIIKAGTREAVARKFIDEELSSRVEVSPSSVDSIYHSRKETYKLDKPRFKASHILLSNRNDADAVYVRLQKGDDFSKLAQDYSVDRQSGEIGGDIGFFNVDDIDPVLAEAVANLDVGSYSKPVRTDYGFHIFMLTDREEAGAQLDSLEGKRRIFENLYTERHAQAFQAMLDDLKSSANIERYPITDSVISSEMGQELP